MQLGGANVSAFEINIRSAFSCARLDAQATCFAATLHTELNVTDAIKIKRRPICMKSSATQRCSNALCRLAPAASIGMRFAQSFARRRRRSRRMLGVRGCDFGAVKRGAPQRRSCVAAMTVAASPRKRSDLGVDVVDGTSAPPSGTEHERGIRRLERHSILRESEKAKDIVDVLVVVIHDMLDSEIVPWNEPKGWVVRTQ
jgi:hypothetical protein